MAKDLFRKPFDEGTIVKLKIFEDYFKEWLPVFIANSNATWKEIKIFDLFAGEGKDMNGVEGSPVRILNVLNANRQLIINNGIKISVVINELERDKFLFLSQTLNQIWDKSIYNLELSNEEFSKVFASYYPRMKTSVNFLFLDQNGIKQITETVFKQLIDLKQTDFLFFISSSYVKRFSELDEFKKYLKITKQQLEGKSYYHIHRIVLSYYRSLITKNYFLAPFSIKKPSGIYGLIFGSNHIYGMEKFLKVCWRHDKLTGEANFDIDNEKINAQNPSLFNEYNIPSKRKLYEQELENKILNASLKTDFDVYLFSLNEGFLPRDANVILKKLKEAKKIESNFKMISEKVHKITNPQEIKIL